MTTTIQRLTQLNMEIEGLLHVLSKRDTDDLRTLLGSKYNEFKSLFESLLEDGSSDLHEVETDVAEVASTLTADEVKDQEATDAEEVPESEAAEEAIERGLSKEMGTSDIEVKPYEGDDDVSEYVAVQPAQAQQVVAPKSDIKHSSANEGEGYPAPSAAETPKSLNEVIGERPDELRVDEMLSRREAKNLRKAFTLNDKFRFRRELFNNDDVLFLNTLNALQDSADYASAVSYLDSQLHWDMKNEDVRDFLSIVKNHFNAI